jgi:hypothetical protein
LPHRNSYHVSVQHLRTQRFLFSGAFHLK